MGTQSDISADQLNEELNSVLTTVMQTQALTTAVVYQQLSDALGADANWSADSMKNLAATIERESANVPRPGIAAAYAQNLKSIAGKLEQLNRAPELRLLDGGKRDPDDDGPAAA